MALAAKITRILLRTLPYLRNLDPDDATQEAYLVLLRASRNYDSSEKCEFSTYLARAIRNRLTSLSSRQGLVLTPRKRRGATLAQSEVRKRSLAVQYVELIDAADTRSPESVSLDDREMIDRGLAKLSPRAREAVECLLSPNPAAARKEWCKRHNLSKSLLSRTTKVALKRLRRDFA